MSDRKVYWVSPDGNDWKVQAEGAQRASSRCDTKAEAFKRARELAQNAPLGRVKIQKRDGSLQEERTYGKDPRRTKG